MNDRLDISENPNQKKKCCPDYSDFIFDQIFIRLAGNEDSRKILDEFNFKADRMIHRRVTCPLVSNRHIMGKILSR